MLDVEIIEISSSPSHSARSFPKSPKHASKGKQKMKLVEVIELTDDDDDEDSLTRLPEPFDPSSSTAPISRNLSKEKLVIDLDATPDDVHPSAETQLADATAISGDTKGILSLLLSSKPINLTLPIHKASSQLEMPVPNLY
jgi:hypothetical protein